MKEGMKHKVMNGLQHSVVGLLIQLIVGLLNPIAGYAANVAFWVGRERRDYEVKSRLDPVKAWYKGWNVFLWTPEDFWPPVILGAILLWSLL